MSSNRVWQDEYERRLVSLIALGGVTIGLGVFAVSPAGFDGTDVLALLALAIGIGAMANILLGRTDPVPVLILIVILGGATAPFVDLALAMALSGVVIGVVATGSILIHQTRAVVAFMTLGLLAIVARPALDTLGYLPVEPSPSPAAAPLVVILVAVISTALSFRALRDQLVLKEDHQVRINELVENTAFHIKTPLTAALGFAYLLRAQVTDPEAAQYADGVIRRGWEASHGLDDIAIVTRSDHAVLDLLSRPVDMNLAVNNCLDDVIGARAKLRHVDVLGFVEGDPNRTHQIIRHLISNAVLHGGTDLFITGRQAGRRYELAIYDNGAPLDEINRGRIFEPFHRLESDEPRAGRGVGLTVSRILAVAMGGDLRFESAPTGNTAILTLRTSRTPSQVRLDSMAENRSSALSN